MEISVIKESKRKKKEMFLDVYCVTYLSSLTYFTHPSSFPTLEKSLNYIFNEYIMDIRKEKKGEWILQTRDSVKSRVANPLSIYPYNICLYCTGLNFR